MRRRDAQENEPGSWKGAWGQMEAASRKPRGVVTEGAGRNGQGAAAPGWARGRDPLPPVRKGGLGPELREETGEERGKQEALLRLRSQGLVLTYRRQKRRKRDRGAGSGVRQASGARRYRADLGPEGGLGSHGLDLAQPPGDREVG